MTNLKMNKTAKRTLVSFALATVLFFTAQSATFANNAKSVATETANNSEIVSVKYVGVQNGNLMFHVSFNSVAKNSTLTLTDEDGETLYSEQIKNESYKKTFALPQDLGVAKVNFIIRTNVATNDGSISTDQVKTFDVANLLTKGADNSLASK